MVRSEQKYCKERQCQEQYIAKLTIRLEVKSCQGTMNKWQFFESQKIAITLKPSTSYIYRSAKIVQRKYICEISVRPVIYIYLYFE